MQMDVKLLRSLDDPNREKPIWFAESETVARAMVASISRLIKTRYIYTLAGNYTDSTMLRNYNNDTEVRQISRLSKFIGCSETCLNISWNGRQNPRNTSRRLYGPSTRILDPPTTRFDRDQPSVL